MTQTATGRRYIRRRQPIGSHALPHIRLRHLLCHRLYGELAAQPLSGGMEVVDARAELRVLRLGGMELLPVASRHHHHRLPRRRRGRPYDNRKEPSRRHGIGLCGALGASRMVQVLRLRLGQRRQPDACVGTGSRRAAPAGGAPHRHFLLHVHGAELRHRHLPPATAAGPSIGPGALSVVLPPPARRPDRPRRRAPAPAAHASGSRPRSTTRVPCG